MFSIAIDLQGGGLSLREILSDIPHDAGAFVAYALLALFIGFIWWGSRHGGTGGADRDGAEGGTPTAPVPDNRSS